MPGFANYSGLNDRQKLVTFLTTLQEVLERLVLEERDHHGNPLFAEELLGPMREAWQNVQSEFEPLRRATAEFAATKLWAHGLHGPQLDFKLRVIDRLWDKFTSLGGGGILRHLLDGIDNLLDSIIDAAGMGGPIKEMKEGIRSSIEDSDGK